MIRLSVDGHGIGETVRLTGPGTIRVGSEAESVLPISSLQLVVNGDVVDEVTTPTPSRRMILSSEVRVEGASWIAARCGGPTYWDGPSHRGPWERRIFAHTSPVYVAFGDGEWTRSDPAQIERMRTLVEAGIGRLRAGRRYPEDRITHHHGEEDHQAFLERPFREALDRLTLREGEDATRS
jgi:hypothetical protein